jgi:von Willebrand factor A domain-containing protein 7
MRAAIPTRLHICIWAALALCIELACPLWPLLIAQTQSSTNRSRSFGPDACGPADPAYIRSANETGGIPLFLQRSEAAKAFHLVRESSRENMSTVLWVTDTLNQLAPQTFEIPVDSATQRITFSFSGDTKGTTLVLTQPSSAPVVQGASNAEITELNCGRIVTVATPERGIWHAALRGSGRFWLQAQAQSDIYFISAQFVRNGGRPGHEGLFRIPGQPLSGIPATLEVSLSAKEVKTRNFYLVSERGDSIQEISMDTVSPDPQFLQLVGTFPLPPKPFRIAVTGRDAEGQPYQRYFSSLFHVETVELSPATGVDELAPGNSTQLTFTVHNVGASANFKITVSDAHRFVTEVRPQELVLDDGESGTVHVDIQVPTAAKIGTNDDIIALASSISGSATSNFCVMHVTVASANSQNPH